jgi:putative membrane protein
VSAPHDPGLAPERTELAWRRTLLAIAVGALVSVRVLPSVLGGWTIATGVGGVIAAAVLWVLARRRHAAALAVFRDRTPASAMPGGTLLLALSLLTAAGAALGLVFAALAPR